MAFRNQLQMVILVQLPINQLMLSCVTLWFCNNSNSITRNYNVFVGCSEISIYVIVKHLKYVGIPWACSLPGADLLSFSVPGGRGGGQKKLLGCSLLGGFSPQAGTMPNVTIQQVSNPKVFFRNHDSKHPTFFRKNSQLRLWSCLPQTDDSLAL